MVFFNSATRIEKDAEKQIKVQRAKNKAITALSNLELERLQNEKKLQPERDEITRLKCETESKNKLQAKSKTYMLSALVLALVSVLMSVSGISKQTNILALKTAFTSENGVFAISIFVLQVIMLGFSFWSYEIQQNHYSTYSKVKLFQTAIIAVSIYCNYQYMCLLVPDTPIICAIFACAFDVGSIYFSELATVTKYRLYSNNNAVQQNATFFEKLRIVLFGHLQCALDRKYQERISEMQKYNVTIDKTKDCGFNDILEKIGKLEKDTVVTKDTLGMDTYDWKLAREQLEKQGLVYCKNKRTYRTDKSLADIAREKVRG